MGIVSKWRDYNIKQLKITLITMTMIDLVYLMFFDSKMSSCII